MATGGMTKAQANVVTRFATIMSGVDLNLVELTKDGSDQVRYGIEDAGGNLLGLVFSKDNPSEDYDVQDLGDNSDE